MKKKLHKLNLQSGTALINALLIVVFIATTISFWIKQTKFHIQQETIAIENQQALQLVEAANIWASQILHTKNFHQTTPEIAHINSKQLHLPRNWAMKAKLVDAQNIFNLNSLSERSMQLTFLVLLKNILGNISDAQLKTIFMSTLASVDSNLAPNKVAQLNKFYMQQKPPYQINGKGFASITEWKKVKGVNSVIYQKLYPYVTVLPESTPININTADKRILLSLRPKLKMGDINKLIFARGDTGFKNASELFAILEELKLPVQNTTIHSQYYWLYIDILCPSKRHIKIKTLFYRRLTPKGKDLNIVLLKQFQLT